MILNRKFRYAIFWRTPMVHNLADSGFDGFATSLDQDLNESGSLKESGSSKARRSLI